MLLSVCIRARRWARVPARPNIRSKVTRGLISIGSGVVGVRPRQRVHVGAGVLRVAAADVAGEVLGRQLDRRKHRVLPICFAITWSIVMPLWTSSAIVRFGIVPLSHAATVVAWPSSGSHSSETIVM